MCTDIVEALLIFKCNEFSINVRLNLLNDQDTIVMPIRLECMLVWDYTSVPLFALRCLYLHFSTFVCTSMSLFTFQCLCLNYGASERTIVPLLALRCLYLELQCSLVWCSYLNIQVMLLQFIGLDKNVINYNKKKGEWS